MSDTISKKSITDWLQQEADERKKLPHLEGNRLSYLRVKEHIESGSFDFITSQVREGMVLNQERYDEARKLFEGWSVWHENKLIVLSVIDRAVRLERENKRLHAKDATIPRMKDEWHEDYSDVLWWSFPIQEPPYCGTPLDADWPDYHTHWTPLVIPEQPNV
ncbi:hypothetical protein HQN90_17720 [Paenibacillus alba]|uniref:hypothetical protein n=1 Tax=Paenibacillus alba TaxID=1197127 RepID=UPI001563E982|nr:hypothetical protein [Paenibacillus alba]NQX67963.1 hypothetical protein [Paenibacillus alba]